LQKQPVAVAVSGYTTPYQQYTGGVITSADCGTEVDHGCLAVGYGVDSESGLEYFLLKNSWGAEFGLDGYVKVGVTSGMGYCGIN